MASSSGLTTDFVIRLQSFNSTYICPEEICHGESKCLKIEAFQVCVCKPDFYGEHCQYQASQMEKPVSEMHWMCFTFNLTLISMISRWKFEFLISLISKFFGYFWILLVVGLAFYAGTKFSRINRKRGTFERLANSPFRSPSSMRPNEDFKSTPSINFAHIQKNLIRSQTLSPSTIRLNP